MFHVFFKDMKGNTYLKTSCLIKK